MSQIIDQADELRKRAIEILLTERTAIDQRLAVLGHDGTPPVASQRLRSCGICGSSEHNARRCSRKNSDVSGPDPNR